MKETKFLIIGAGITGLSFANYVNDYILLEKENKVGGYCKTINRNGYTWDYAGHFFHFKTDEFKNKFLDIIPKDDIIYKDKCTKIKYNDLLIDYPFQMNIHQLNKDDFIDCLYDLYNKEEKQQYNNFLDMLYGKFGKSITEKFLRPYNEKLYACDLRKLDTDAMGRFFPYADKESIINNMKNSKDSSYNNYFLYPKGGAETFIDILYDNLDKKRILLNTKVIDIDYENKIVITNQGKIKYNYLINTIPLNNFINLFGGSYDSIMEELSYNKVLVLNLGFEKKANLTKEHWIYFPNKKLNFYRVGFYNNILNQKQASLYVEIGYDKNYVIDKKQLDEQLKITIANLIDEGIIESDNKLIDYEAIVMNPAYVHISKKVENIKNNLFDEFKKHNIYSIGRYGAWTYCSMEDCMVQAKDLAKTLTK